MSIAAIASQGGINGHGGASVDGAASRSIQATRQEAMPDSGAGASGQVKISFAPPTETRTPMDRIGSGLLDTLRNFEQTRLAKRDAMSTTQGGPASPVALAKDELLAGPASVRPASGSDLAGNPAQPMGVEDALGAMTRSFDYAIETQLIVKTGSQFSSSASSLMRGQ